MRVGRLQGELKITCSHSPTQEEAATACHCWSGYTRRNASIGNKVRLPTSAQTSCGGSMGFSKGVS